MAEKVCVLTLLQKGDFVIAVARDIGVSREVFFQLKWLAALLPPKIYRRGSRALAHLRRPYQERISF